MRTTLTVSRISDQSCRVFAATPAFSALNPPVFSKFPVANPSAFSAFSAFSVVNSSRFSVFSAVIPATR